MNGNELMGSKRGWCTQELALSRLLKTIALFWKSGVYPRPSAKGAVDAGFALGYLRIKRNYQITRRGYEKKIEYHFCFPRWSGNVYHGQALGISASWKKLSDYYHGKILWSLQYKVFRNMVFKKLLDKAPELSGAWTWNHGSISAELSNWVEIAAWRKLKRWGCH